jgi:hypothetical protein
MRPPTLRTLVASLLAVAGTFVNVGVAGADTTVPPSSVGYDISFPQCGSSLPSSAGFGVVGVNNGHPFSLNPCLLTELQWAKNTLTQSPQFYLNTADPGPSGNADWPSSQQTPQICVAGQDSVSCSYDYGWNAAQNSFQNAVAAETQIGSPAPTTAASAAQWWLDVETGNAWESLRNAGGPTSAQYANDKAVIQGELAYLTGVGVTTAGIYSTSYQFSQIAGSVGTAFAGVQVWLPGYASLADAQAACSTTSFTGGRVAMIQYPSNGLDGDYLCGLVSTPGAGAVPVSASASFSQQLSVLGASGPVTYTQTTGSSALVVSSSGLVTTSGTLPFGVYAASGTSAGGGLTGTFTFVLTVGAITQLSPDAASSPVSATASFTNQIELAGAIGMTTFTQTSGAPALVVTSSGLITTSGALSPGSYTVTGTVSDAAGDQGAYSFTLTVGLITQSPPIRVKVSAAGSASFTQQIAATGGVGPLGFSQTTGAPSLVVSPTGVIITSGVLAPGSYVARGVMSDASGDRGSYFFNLVVGSSTPTQSPPIRARVPAAGSASFTQQIAATGGVGPLSFSQTTGAPSLVVSPTGVITTSGVLAPGSYVARGVMSDASGDRGSYFFNLVVGPSSLAQSSPTSATVSSTLSGSFHQQIAVSGAVGAVTFTQTTGLPALSVSPVGSVTTSGSLAAGTYVAGGAVSDAAGAQGTFSFSLVVSAARPTHVGPIARRVLGHAIAGRTVTLRILGQGFYGRPIIRGQAGTTVVVRGDTGTTLTLRVSVAARSRRGVHVFIILFAHGKIASVRYVQR